MKTLENQSTRVDDLTAEPESDSPIHSGLFKTRIIAGRYRLRREISRGGMGVLWAARDERLERDVAVKFMNMTRCRPSEEDNRRFALEAKAEAQLGEETDHVVKVLDYGVDRDTRYIVMEYLIGEDLGARLEREKRLSVAALYPIVRQVAAGLKKAHQRRLVHRDIKPANIFLFRRDDEERAKIVDFGVVKALGQAGASTISGKIVGTPAYMAPEQIAGVDVDPRSDLWSLGIVLYEAITGRLPYEDEEMNGLITGICFHPIPPPSRFDPSLPGDVDAFFARALARPLAERFQTAEELARAWAALARVSLPPPSSDSLVR